LKTKHNFSSFVGSLKIVFNPNIFFLSAGVSLPFITGNFIDLGQEKKNTKEF